MTTIEPSLEHKRMLFKKLARKGYRWKGRRNVLEIQMQSVCDVLWADQHEAGETSTAVVVQRSEGGGVTRGGIRTTAFINTRGQPSIRRRSSQMIRWKVAVPRKRSTLTDKHVPAIGKVTQSWTNPHAIWETIIRETQRNGKSENKVLVRDLLGVTMTAPPTSLIRYYVPHSPNPVIVHLHYRYGKPGERKQNRRHSQRRRILRG